MRSYYVEQGVLQYFVESSALAGVDAKAEMDFTYRNDGSAYERVICNFTLSTTVEQPVSVSRASFSVDSGARFDLQEVSVLFLDRPKHAIRVSTNMPYECFERLMNAHSVSFEVIADGRLYDLAPSDAFYSRLNDARRELIGS